MPRGRHQSQPVRRAPGPLPGVRRGRAATEATADGATQSPAPRAAPGRDRRRCRRVLRRVRAIERARTVHIGSDRPGEELFVDTFSVGRLEGVGTVWQLSAVDGASSFGIARVVAGDKTSAVMARFLADDVLPVLRRAGVRLVTATTDNGPEFGRAFGEACREAGVRHHRIPPRSPNLNAFVERCQGTVLHLHDRVAFRYRSYLKVDTIDADLQAFLGYSNFERPHPGYRTKGRTPASIFVRGTMSFTRWERATMTDMPPDLSGRNVGRKG